MIGVLTHHWAKADKIDEAKRSWMAMGVAQSKAPGFVSRQTLIALADPTKITTLVIWTDQRYLRCLEGQSRSGRRRCAAPIGSGPSIRKSERFQMVG